MPARAEEGWIRTARMGKTTKQGARARAKARRGAEKGGVSRAKCGDMRGNRQGSGQRMGREYGGWSDTDGG